MIYLGIDPGSRIIGYGLINVSNNKVSSAQYGIIKLNTKNELAQRIEEAYAKIFAVISEAKPDKSAIESIFFGKNIKSAFTLGHVRGAIILAMAQNKLPICEYSPREIKKAVTGNGNATKEQVQYMLTKLLPLRSVNQENNIIPEDASDALGVAFCLYNHDRFNTLSSRIPALKR